MKNDKTFTGTGWSFPPTFDQNSKTVEMTTDREDIERSLEILLGTIKGERVFQSSYGCNLDEMVFESFNLTVKNYLVQKIKTAILFYEARIEPIAIELDESMIYDGQILIKIDYLIRSTNSRFNMVYPFYLNEGIDIQQLIRS